MEPRKHLFMINLSQIFLIFLIMVNVFQAQGQSTDKVELIMTDENGLPTDTVKSNDYVTLNCSFTTTSPYVLLLTNGSDKVVYTYNYRNKWELIGEGYETRVRNIKNPKMGWISLELFVPYCHFNGLFTCEVVTRSPAATPSQFHNTTSTIAVGQVREPELYYIGKRIACGTPMSPDRHYGLECRVTQVSPLSDFTWSGCEEYGIMEIIEDKEKCMFTQRTRAICPKEYTDTRFNCSVSNPSGSKECVLDVV